MAKTAMIRARVEPELKREVDDVFTELGLSAMRRLRCFTSKLPFTAGCRSRSGFLALQRSKRLPAWQRERLGPIFGF